MQRDLLIIRTQLLGGFSRTTQVVHPIVWLGLKEDDSACNVIEKRRQGTKAFHLQRIGRAQISALYISQRSDHRSHKLVILATALIAHDWCSQLAGDFLLPMIELYRIK